VGGWGGDGLLLQKHTAEPATIHDTHRAQTNPNFQHPDVQIPDRPSPTHPSALQNCSAPHLEELLVVPKLPVRHQLLPPLVVLRHHQAGEDGAEVPNLGGHARVLAFPGEDVHLC